MALYSLRASVLLPAIFATVTMLFTNTTLANTPTPEKQLAALEATANGRLGVYAINTGNNASIQYHATDRFPVCSTSKVIIVSAILQKSMTDKDLLQQKVTYKKSDLMEYSPITGKHVNDGMTIAELCAAAIMYSDNTAANLLIQQLGGPAAVTAYARSIGNTKFRLDRTEPTLNTAIPGDKRDTATPLAMGESLQKLVLGNTLATPQREQLQAWLKGNTTGNLRIRAGVPTGWIVGDKTGTGDYGTSNDIGIIWPPKGAPVIVAIYFTQPNQDAAPNDAIIAAATKVVINNLG